MRGKCIRTGCDGIIGSKLQFDKCGVCGGDSTGCIRVIGNFTKRRYERRRMSVYLVRDHNNKRRRRSAKVVENSSTVTRSLSLSAKAQKPDAAFYGAK